MIYYPAIFELMKGDGYLVSFTDFEYDTQTFTDSIEYAMKRAGDVLSMHMYQLRQDGVRIPAPFENSPIALRASNEKKHFYSVVRIDEGVGEKILSPSEFEMEIDFFEEDEQEDEYEEEQYAMQFDEMLYELLEEATCNGKDMSGLSIKAENLEEIFCKFGITIQY